MSLSRELIVASLPAQMPSDIATRYETNHLVDFGHLNPQILPAHVAESLSRGLAIIPLYSEKYLDAEPAMLMNRPVAVSLDARSTLRRSLCVANDIRTTLSRLLHILESSGKEPTPHEARTIRELTNNIACIAESTRNAFSRVHRTAQSISQELAAHVHKAPVVSVPRWTKAARIGSFCVSFPAFIAAVLSAVWNTKHPMLALIMALVSATAAMCGGIGPCIAQWYWEKRDQSPSRADLQAVRIEMYRLCYPLSVLTNWWLRLAEKFHWLAKWTEGVDHAIHKLPRSLAEHLDRYIREMQGILNSVETEIATVTMGNAEDIA